MFLNLKLSLFLFTALLFATCDSFSIFQKCYKRFRKADVSKLDAKSIIKDINNFEKNFDARYKELQAFIKNNSTHTENVDVAFYLFTQDNPKKREHLKEDQLKKSHFNYENPITVLVHGLQPLKEKDYATKALREAIISRYQHNVIVMKYKKVASMPYTEALKNSFTVARKAADFLEHLLKTFKITARKMHLIGFEFGGQLVGNIGHLIPGLARITALDPAGALFPRFHADHRISPDDAVFVDIIHTSTKKFPRGLGMAMPAGHQDFYPNGGKRQPGCKHNITAQMAGGRDEADFKNAICDNVRSMELYIESVCDLICRFRGRKCNSYKDYESFDCPPFINPSKTMGFHASKGRSMKPLAKFYLDTNSKYPYCTVLKILH